MTVLGSHIGVKMTIFGITPKVINRAQMLKTVTFDLLGLQKWQSTKNDSTLHQKSMLSNQQNDFHIGLPAVASRWKCAAVYSRVFI